MMAVGLGVAIVMIFWKPVASGKGRSMAIFQGFKFGF